jgi:hypothetical protein
MENIVSQIPHADEKSRMFRTQPIPDFTSGNCVSFVQHDDFPNTMSSWCEDTVSEDNICICNFLCKSTWTKY